MIVDPRCCVVSRYTPANFTLNRNPSFFWFLDDFFTVSRESGTLPNTRVTNSRGTVLLTWLMNKRGKKGGTEEGSGADGSNSRGDERHGPFVSPWIRSVRFATFLREMQWGYSNRSDGLMRNHNLRVSIGEKAIETPKLWFPAGPFLRGRDGLTRNQNLRVTIGEKSIETLKFWFLARPSPFVADRPHFDQSRTSGTRWRLTLEIHDAPWVDAGYFQSAPPSGRGHPTLFSFHLLASYKNQVNTN